MGNRANIFIYSNEPKINLLHADLFLLLSALLIFILQIYYICDDSNIDFELFSLRR